MNLKEIKKKRSFKILTNVYVVIFLIFAVWMLFLDENSYLVHREFDKEIESLQKWNDYHQKKIAEDKATIKQLNDSVLLEKYAREKYLMKKENEDIYVIEVDTID